VKEDSSELKNKICDLLQWIDSEEKTPYKIRESISANMFFMIKVFVLFYASSFYIWGCLVIHHKTLNDGLHSGLSWDEKMWICEVLLFGALEVWNFWHLVLSLRLKLEEYFCWKGKKFKIFSFCSSHLVFSLKIIDQIVVIVLDLRCI